MKNGKLFSTGNHPVESLVPMLHLKNAGFEFEIATPTGKSAVFEMWAFPKKDEHVKAIYNEHKSSFEKPLSLTDFISTSFDQSDKYAAIFIPGGHGAMIGIPEDKLSDIFDAFHQVAVQDKTCCLIVSPGPGPEIYRGFAQ